MKNSIKNNNLSRSINPNKQNKKGLIKKIVILLIFGIFLIISQLINLTFGKTVTINFLIFLKSMVIFIPGVFILIGIFEVWVKRELIVRHMGKESGIRGYIWALILSGSAVGGFYVAFPIAYSLQKKGARTSVIFSYIGSATVAKVPMTLYEASYLGVKFSVIRLLTAIPLVILSSIFMEKILDKKGFKIKGEEGS